MRNPAEHIKISPDEKTSKKLAESSSYNSTPSSNLESIIKGQDKQKIIVNSALQDRIESRKTQIKMSSSKLILEEEKDQQQQHPDQDPILKEANLVTTTDFMSAHMSFDPKQNNKNNQFIYGSFSEQPSSQNSCYTFKFRHQDADDDAVVKAPLQ